MIVTSVRAAVSQAVLRAEPMITCRVMIETVRLASRTLGKSTA
jgi:hypothetical protein